VYPIQPSQLVMIDYLVIGIPSLILALESNNRLVEGNFLANVIKKALPGALVVMINSLIVFAFTDTLNMNNLQISTVIVLTATVTSLLVLLRLLVPFNRPRMTLYVLMVGGFLASIIFLPNFFSFAPFVEVEFYPEDPLTIPQILLFTTLAQMSFPLMYVMSNIVGWFKQFVKNALNKIAE
jgi:cation-transporting ATPase E